MNEMDLPNTFPNGTESLKYGGTPQAYVDAYRRIYNIAEQVGATGAKHAWVWSPGKWDQTTMEYYPGGNYMDWAGMSVYSAAHECVNFSSRVSGWHQQFAATKPMIITEGAASGCYQSSSFKSEWISDWFSVPFDFPGIRALVWFNEDVWNPGEPPHDFSLTDPQDLAAYRTGVASTTFIKNFQP
jgi:beta-mannanase